MVPTNKIEELISKHSLLEKELSSGKTEKKQFAEKSKEYSDLNYIIKKKKKYISFEKEKNELELKKNLSTKNFEMASTLGAMQRLSIQKANIVAFKPNDALNTLRTTSLLKVILPNLKNRALIIENDLSDLDNIRAEMRQQSIELKKNRANLDTVNNEIDDLLKKRIGRQSNIEYSTIKERERLRVFAETAINLEDLIKIFPEMLNGKTSGRILVDLNK